MASINYSPLTLDLGSTIQGATLTGSFTFRLVNPTPGYSYNYILTCADPSFVIQSPNAGVLTPNVTFTRTVTITKPAPGTFTSQIKIQTSAGTKFITVKAVFTALTGGLTPTPSNADFATGQLNQAPTTITISLHNPNAGPATITALTFNGGPFSSPTALPFTINAGLDGTFDVVCDWSLIGIWSKKVTVVNSIADLDVPITAGVYFVNSVDVLLGLTFGLILGLGQTPQKADVTTLDPAFDCDLVFNGAVWNNPGNEKTLRRLQVMYRNVGVCTGLKLTVSTWRQTLTPSPGQFDIDTETITIGNANADNSEMTAFFDVELPGEIIVISLTRLSGTGPVALLGFIPHFEDKGEKVEGV